MTVAGGLQFGKLGLMRLRVLPAGSKPAAIKALRWALLMSMALNKIWRRHRLAQHGLDPNLVDAIRRQRDARLHEDYVRRFGPRPESAKFQANSSPF